MNYPLPTNNKEALSNISYMAQSEISNRKKMKDKANKKRRFKDIIFCHQTIIGISFFTIFDEICDHPIDLTFSSEMTS